MPLRLTEILAQVMELEHLIVQRSAFTGPNASHGARLTLVLSVKPQLHLEERCLRVSQPTRAPYFTNSISLGRQVLSKNNSCWLWRRRNILHPQCFDWNAKPLRCGGAFRKQRNMQWRMVRQHGVQFYVVGGGGARDVERRLDWRMRLKGEAAVQRDVKDEPEIEIDRVEGR